MQDLKSFVLPKNFRGRGAIVCQFWWLVQGVFFATSPQFMYGYRVWMLRLFGAKIGKGVIIRPSVKVTYPWKLKIGDYSWIGDDVTLYNLGHICIGSNVVISQKSYLCTGSHDYSVDSFDIFTRDVVVQDEVWIASDVFIHPGVVVGEGCVVAARSTVVSDLRGGYIYSGNPAIKVRDRLNFRG